MLIPLWLETRNKKKSSIIDYTSIEYFIIFRTLIWLFIGKKLDKLKENE